MIYNDGYIIVSCSYFIWNPVTGLAGASEVMLKLGKYGQHQTTVNLLNDEPCPYHQENNALTTFISFSVKMWLYGYQ